MGNPLAGSGQDRGVSIDPALPTPTPAEAPEAAAGSAPEAPADAKPAPEEASSNNVTTEEATTHEMATGESAGGESASDEPASDESAVEAPTDTAPAAGRPLPAGVDEATVVARMTEVVLELEAIAATPVTLDGGKHPDDRALTERMRVLEDTFRTLTLSGIQEPALRSRVQTARAIFANARSHRAETRAVERARAGETKRALLVEAFALSQLAQGTSLSQLAGRRVGEEIEPETVEPETVKPETVEAAADESIARDVVAADATAGDTELPASSEAAEEAAIEPVDATLADTTIADVEADAASADAPDETPAEDPTDLTDPTETTDDPAEVAVADAPTLPDAEAGEAVVPEKKVRKAKPEPAPVTTTPHTIDIGAIARRARELQNEWTNAGFAGREVENELQPLFRRYMQLVFDLSRKESNEKADARRELVAEARALADQAGDDVGNEAITRLVREAKALQNKWKAGEAAPPAVESGAWRQFSGALRQIFVARDRLAAGAKEEREQIINAVKALAEAREPMRAMRDLGPLLRRWRESGPVSTPVYESLKVQLDRAAATVRERADVERKKRDAEDAKSQGERAKNASKIIREAERSNARGGGRRQERPAAAAQAQGALAAALAEAFGRAERVAQDVRDLERTVIEVRDKLARAESGALVAGKEEVQTTQGFTVQRQTIDPGAVNPERLRAELAQAEQALARRQSELQELTSNARGYGLTG